jgi:hypothetical protein
MSPPALISGAVAAHPFAVSVVRMSTILSKNVQKPRSALSIEFETTRDLTEGEFYVLGCGYSIAHLIGLITQLEQIPVYLSNYKSSRRLNSAGVNRVSHIVYHWENYLIRARSLEDRVLHLVKDVLHLGIHDRDVAFNSIRRNAHVTGGDGNLATLLDRIHSIVGPVAGERNRIIRGRGLLDADIRKLEFWLLLGRLGPDHKGVAAGQYMTGIRYEVPKRVSVITAFVAETGKFLQDLFDDLMPRFTSTVNRLMPDVGHAFEQIQSAAE